MIEKGERNQILTEFAKTLWWKKLGDAFIALIVKNQISCIPPLPYYEVYNIAIDAIEKYDDPRGWI